MNRIWRQLAIASNWPVLVAVGVLCFMGIVSIWAASPSDGKKQLVFLAICLVAMGLLQGVNYQHIGRFAWVFYVISVLLLIYTIIPLTHGPKGDQRLFRVPDGGGAFRWINLKVLTLQPSELTKFAFCLAMARYLRFRNNYRTVGGLVLPFVIALVPAILILRQPDLGTALVFVPGLFIMLFAAGAKMKHLLAVVGMGAAFVPIAWMAGTDVPVFRHMPALVKDYQRKRVTAMFSNDPAVQRETGYQQAHALIAFGSGGWTGRGFGNIPVGRQVPESHNDMIFALIGEQFGFVGVAVVLAAYLVLLASGVEIASATKEPFGRLVAIGTVSLLAGQAFLNMMVCTRLMPVTGITLPFVSYGGSSLLASFIAVGLLLNIGQNRPLMMGPIPFEYD